MTKNYFNIAFRHLWKRKIFSAINIAGLALGMAACLLIFQYVSFELSFDQFHSNGKNIYRVVNDRHQNGKLIQHGTMTYSAVGKAMKEDYPDEIAAHTRVALVQNRILINKEEKTEQNGLAVDNSFLTMFSFPLLAGDRQTSLEQPNSLVLSESVTRKIFDYNGKDFQLFIGRLLTIENDSVPYQVTGICKDVPENSQLQFDFLLSYVSLYSGGNGSWKAANHSFKSSFFWHYIQLKPGADYKGLQARFPAFSKQHFNSQKQAGIEESFYLQPLLKTHLYSDFEYDIIKKGSAIVVWGLLAIALFIIIIAWANYVNLTTAKSVERAKEVGVRKLLGALRVQLIRQFLVESLLLNVVSLILAIILVWTIQPFFNQMLGHELSLSFLFQKGMGGYYIIGGFALLLVVGILAAGFYPAFVLSSFKPVTVLKGRFSSSFKGVALRKALVIGQFAITVTLIICSLVIYRQIRFMNKQELGLRIDEILVIKPPLLTRADDSSFLYRLNDFKEEIKQLANVKGATGSNRVPGNDLSRIFDVHPAGDTTNLHTLNSWGVNHDFIDLYKMKMIAGRQFVFADQDFDRSSNVILNESAVKLLGYQSPEATIGSKIVVFGKQREIVGVTADFHHKSLRYPMEPTVLIPTYGTSNSISVKLNSTANMPQSIAAIRIKYEAFFPGNLFDYYFLDEKFNQQYKDDKLFGKIFGLFAGFAIFIACLGLFGLSLFITTQRIKEIGVRKVLGASVSNILLLVSKDFIKLVIVAAVIAFPIAWWVMSKWLQDFAYRIDIGWWVFMIAAAAVFFVALVTVSFQAMKAAIANPVKSLRTE